MSSTCICMVACMLDLKYTYMLCFSMHTLNFIRDISSLVKPWRRISAVIDMYSAVCSLKNANVLPRVFVRHGARSKPMFKLPAPVSTSSSSACLMEETRPLWLMGKQGVARRTRWENHSTCCRRAATASSRERCRTCLKDVKH